MAIAGVKQKCKNATGNISDKSHLIHEASRLLKPRVSSFPSLRLMEELLGYRILRDSFLLLPT